MKKTALFLMDHKEFIFKLTVIVLLIVIMLRVEESIYTADAAYYVANEANSNAEDAAQSAAKSASSAEEAVDILHGMRWR